MNATALSGVAVVAGRAGGVLVVDDHEPIRSLVRFVLEDEGYAVAEAPNGAEALLMAGAMAPRLILLDVNMPVLDGPGFVAAYRDRPGPHAPIVVLTAATDAACWAAKLGAVGHLGKPFDLTSLVAVVARCTGRIVPASL